MTYQTITQYSSPNFYSAARCLSRYGRPRKIKGITIHWWGDPKNKPTFQNTINYLCRAGGITSAHFVIEAGRSACIVDPDDAAWHSGSSVGNAETIGIECNPRASDEDYITIAEQIRDLRAVYGDLYLKRHSDWKATACPGVYDLARLDALSRKLPTAVKPPVVEQNEGIDMLLISSPNHGFALIGPGYVRGIPSMDEVYALKNSGVPQAANPLSDAAFVLATSACLNGKTASAAPVAPAVTIPAIDLKALAAEIISQLKA